MRLGLTASFAFPLHSAFTLSLALSLSLTMDVAVAVAMTEADADADAAAAVGAEAAALFFIHYTSQNWLCCDLFHFFVSCLL